MSQKSLLVGLDVGTTKISCLVGEVSSHNPEEIHIIGVGTAPSSGLRRGVVINIEQTVESISKAVREAENRAGIQIKEAIVGIAGGHIQSLNSTGVVAVKDKEVSEADIRRVIEAARAVAIPMDREVIHVIPQEYKVDDQVGIRSPIGMSAVRLESKIHIVTGGNSSSQNLIKCCNRAGIQVAELCVEPIASAEAVATDEEKELGVVVVDIGGGTTDIAIYRNGALAHTAVLPLGGNHLTNDITHGLRTPPNEAERLKIEFGCAMAALVNPEEIIEVPSVGDRKSRTIQRRLLAEVIEPRLEEIFNLVRAEIEKSGHHPYLPGGLVFTGGTTMLTGIVELAEFVLDMPVKRGTHFGLKGLKEMVDSPRFSTGIGLIRHGAKKGSRIKYSSKDGISSRVKGSVSSWIKDLF